MKYIRPVLDTKKLITEFKKQLKEVKSTTGTFNFSYKFNEPPKNTELPVVIIEHLAQVKMKHMIETSTGEVGWHGIVERQGNTFRIKDIIVYPQMVTAVTVTTDETEYGNWLQTLDDETFNHLRMQGHSHVNMHTTPSMTDENFYASILRTLQKDDYYIFIINNKRNELNIMIYDYARNIIFDKKDINVQYETNGINISEWYAKEVAPLVTTPIRSYSKATTTKANKTNKTDFDKIADKYGYGYGYTEQEDDLDAAYDFYYGTGNYDRFGRRKY